MRVALLGVTMCLSSQKNKEDTYLFKRPIIDADLKITLEVGIQPTCGVESNLFYRLLAAQFIV